MGARATLVASFDCGVALRARILAGNVFAEVDVAFSVLCWNIEKLNDSKPARVQAVADAIREHDPDVIGILEFLAKDAARRLVRDFFTDYDFAFTDSKMSIEILVGWRRGKFAQVLYTQRRELQAGSENLRPGGLLCVRQKGSNQFNNMLFLHTDSGTTAKEYATRRTMFGKIFSLNKALETLLEQEGKSRFMALGDLNTMGRAVAPNVSKVTEAQEIALLATAAMKANMQVLTKSAPKTWSSPSGSKKGNLDHVIASNDLSFKTQEVVDGQPVKVLVDGWVNKTGNARRSFIENVSDHSMQFLEIE